MTLKRTVGVAAGITALFVLLLPGKLVSVNYGGPCSDENNDICESMGRVCIVNENGVEECVVHEPCWDSGDDHCESMGKVCVKENGVQKCVNESCSGSGNDYCESMGKVCVMENDGETCVGDGPVVVNPNCPATCSYDALRSQTQCGVNWTPVAYFDLNIDGVKEIDVFSDCLVVNDGSMRFYDITDFENYEEKLKISYNVYTFLYEDRSIWPDTKHSSHYFYVARPGSIEKYQYNPFSGELVGSAVAGYSGTGVKVGVGLLKHWWPEVDGGDLSDLDIGMNFLYAGNIGYEKEISGFELKHSWLPVRKGMRNIYGSKKARIEGMALYGDYMYVSIGVNNSVGNNMPAQVRVYKVNTLDGKLLGETCSTCSTDARCYGDLECNELNNVCADFEDNSCSGDPDCDEGMYCNTYSSMCENKCGNGIVDPGEDCSNCKIDAGCASDECCNHETLSCTTDLESCECEGTSCPDGFRCTNSSRMCVRTCGDIYRQGYISSIAQSNFYFDGGGIIAVNGYLYFTRIESEDYSLDNSDEVKMVVYSLENPGNPQKIKTISLGAVGGLGNYGNVGFRKVNDLTISANHKLIDVSDPANPVVLTGPDRISNVVVAKDGYLYVYSNRDVYVYDINGCAPNIRMGNNSGCPNHVVENPVAGEPGDEWSYDNTLAELYDAMIAAGVAKSEAFDQYLLDKAEARQDYIDARNAAVFAYKNTMTGAFATLVAAREAEKNAYLQARQTAFNAYLAAKQNEYDDAIAAKENYLQAKEAYNNCVSTNGASSCSYEEANYQNARTELIEKINIYKDAKEAARAVYEAAKAVAKEAYLNNTAAAKNAYTATKDNAKDAYRAAKQAAEVQYKVDVAAAWAKYVPFKLAYFAAKAAYLAALEGGGGYYEGD